MAESIIHSEAGEKWISWFRKVFEDGQDSLAEESVRLVLRLAAGHADALSGCYLSVHYDLDRLVQHADQIATEKLYSLRIRSLP